MKAMIFAAGVGSRLKELTRDTPKCLMQVGGRTMLEHIISQLRAVGVTSVAINVHHHADKVIDFVRANDSFGLHVHFSREDTLLDTGGGLKKVADFFSNEEAFFIHNADVFTDLDLTQLLTQHRSKKAIGTLAVMERPSQRGLYFDTEHRLVGWSKEHISNIPNATLFAFSGISVASHELFSHMGSDAVFSIITSYLAAARATGRVWGQIVTGIDWTDIGTPEQLSTLQRRFDGA